MAVGTEILLLILGGLLSYQYLSTNRELRRQQRAITELMSGIMFLESRLHAYTGSDLFISAEKMMKTQVDDELERIKRASESS